MMDQSKPTLYLVRGVSGAGKSTLAALIANRPDILNYEADMYFKQSGEYLFNASNLQEAHNWCRNMTEYAIKRHFSVVVSNTSTTEKEVKVYQDIAKECNANFVSLIVENRSDTISIHDVPEDVLKKQRNRFSVKL